jgi:DNA-binding LytR/AlgR family response regulator
MQLKPLRTIIIDANTHWHKVIEDYVKNHSNLELIGSFSTPHAAYDIIIEGGVDLILFDIDIDTETPDTNGIEFIRNVPKPPFVIFITQYTQFAAESYEVNAIDFLVKPFESPRFLKAIDKVVGRWAEKLVQPSDVKFFFIRENNNFVKIKVKKILYLKAMENYTQIFTNEGIHTTLLPLTVIEYKLPLSLFQRVHRSFVVNLSKISSVNKSEIFIKDLKIPLSINHSEIVMNILVKSHLIAKN